MDTNTLPEKPKRKYNINHENAKRLNKMAQATGLIGKHGPLKTTLTKQQVYKEMQEKILARTLKLTNAQTMLGLGTIKVFRVDAHYEMFGKNKKLIKDKPKIVKDDDEIIKVLDHEYGDGPNPSSEEDGIDDYPKFYFVETKDANNSAIESQLNRVFGKAVEKLEMDVKGVAPVIVGMKIVDNSKKYVESVDITDKQLNQETETPQS